MTALAADLTAEAGIMILDGVLDVGSYQAPYTIDSENVLVTGGDNSTTPSIIRGANGTAPATHSAGATVTSGWGGGVANPLTADLDMGGYAIIGPSARLHVPFGILGDVDDPSQSGGSGSLEWDPASLGGGAITMQGGYGLAGYPGAPATITGGAGNDTNDAGASITVGGGDGSGGAGAITFFNPGGPVIPLTTPTTQDVIDALVALGLVTQSD